MRGGDRGAPSIGNILKASTPRWNRRLGHDGIGAFVAFATLAFAVYGDDDNVPTQVADSDVVCGRLVIPRLLALASTRNSFAPSNAAFIPII